MLYREANVRLWRFGRRVCRFADQQRAVVLGNWLEADGIDTKIFLLHRIWMDWLGMLDHYKINGFLTLLAILSISMQAISLSLTVFTRQPVESTFNGLFIFSLKEHRSLNAQISEFCSEKDCDMGNLFSPRAIAVISRIVSKFVFIRVSTPNMKFSNISIEFLPIEQSIFLQGFT